MGLLNILNRIFHSKPCNAVDDPERASAEKMKYEKGDHEISRESHALGNAVAQMQGAAKDIRRSADALTRLARGL